MDFLEKNLEQIIFETPIEDLCDRNLGFLDPRSKFLRQVDLFPYGVADLIEYKIDRKRQHPKRMPLQTYDYEIMIHIIELKKDIIGVSALLQLHRYKTAVRRIMESLNDSPNNYTYKIRGVLIGREMEKNNDFVFLYNFLEHDNIYTYTYNFDGIQFHHQSKEWFNKGDNSLVNRATDFLADIDNLEPLKESAKERIHDISSPILFENNE